MRMLSWMIALFCMSCVVKEEAEDRGFKLAKTHCGSCHQFPDPKLLDRQSWEANVLPAMALRLGRIPDVNSHAKLQDQYFHLTENELVPEEALLSEQEWEHLQQFYLGLAPDSLSLDLSPLPENEQFAIKTGKAFTAGLLPAVTHVHYSQHMQKLLFGAYGSQQIYLTSTDSADEVLMNAPSMLTHVQDLADERPAHHRLLLTYLGQVIRPDAPAAGVLGEATLRQGQLADFQLLPLPMLHRPTQAEYINLSGDAEPELLISEFGYFKGRLAYWQKDNDGDFVPYLISSEPGVVQFDTLNYQGDGFTDLIVLFAHGHERISLFENQGNGRFEEKVLLRFPPVYGSSSFVLADLDGDQLQDIVYTCGDNADLSPIAKDYHGLYIFRNEGEDQYREIFHQPMPGAYEAVVEDFDLDGDLDVAALAFFVAEDRAESPAFIYLEQTEPLKFSASTHDISPLGRWISMDLGDIDEDGDQDLMLGNGYGLTGLDMIQKVKTNAAGPWLLLENQARNPEK